jgi:hypothetical protein
MKSLKGFMVFVSALAVGVALVSTAFAFARQIEAQSKMQLMKREADAPAVKQEANAIVAILQNQITRRIEGGRLFDIPFKSIFEVVRFFVQFVMRCRNPRSMSVKFEPIS